MKTKTVYVVQYYSHALRRWVDCYAKNLTTRRECVKYISEHRKGGGISFRIVQKPEDITEEVVE